MPTVRHPAVSRRRRVFLGVTLQKSFNMAGSGRLTANPDSSPASKTPASKTPASKAQASKHLTSKSIWQPGTAACSDVPPFIVMDVMAAAARLEAAGRRIIHMEVGQPHAAAPSTARAAAHAALTAARIGYTE